jgi:hypothetical protein
LWCRRAPSFARLHSPTLVLWKNLYTDAQANKSRSNPGGILGRTNKKEEEKTTQCTIAGGGDTNGAPSVHLSETWPSRDACRASKRRPSRVLAGVARADPLVTIWRAQRLVAHRISWRHGTRYSYCARAGEDSLVLARGSNRCMPPAYSISNGPGTIGGMRHDPKKHDPSPTRGTINSA